MHYLSSYGLCDVLKPLYLVNEIYWLLHKGCGKRLLLLMSYFGGLSCVAGERERERDRRLSLSLLSAPLRLTTKALN